jgi:hypothetical protein
MSERLLLRRYASNVAFNDVNISPFVSSETRPLYVLTNDEYTFSAGTNCPAGKTRIAGDAATGEGTLRPDV